MVSAGEHIHSQLAKVDGVILPYAESTGCAVGIRNNEIDPVLFSKLRKGCLHAVDAGLPNHFANK